MFLSFHGKKFNSNFDLEWNFSIVLLSRNKIGLVLFFFFSFTKKVQYFLRDRDLLLFLFSFSAKFTNVEVPFSRKFRISGLWFRFHGKFENLQSSQMLNSSFTMFSRKNWLSAKLSMNIFFILGDFTTKRCFNHHFHGKSLRFHEFSVSVLF